MVAATIRKMQAKNQLAAVLDVSGSPLLNLPYVQMCIRDRSTAPMA